MSRKKTRDPQPITTPADAWDLGYAEDAWFLVEFGQYLPAGMIHNAVKHDPDLTAAFGLGSRAHSHDTALGRTGTAPNPYRPPEEVKS